MTYMPQHLTYGPTLMPYFLVIDQNGRGMVEVSKLLFVDFDIEERSAGLHSEDAAAPLKLSMPFVVSR